MTPEAVAAAEAKVSKDFGLEGYLSQVLNKRMARDVHLQSVKQKSIFS